MTFSSSSSPQPPPKKRKLRKGTHSCWECKRRKAKCIFTTSIEICVECRRRGIACVSQEDDDVALDGKSNASDERLERIESMLEALVEHRKVTDTSSGEKPLTQALQESNVPIPVKVTQTASPTSNQTPSPQDLNMTLTETLLSLLPPSPECQAICDSAKFIPCFFSQLLTRNYMALSASSYQVAISSVPTSKPLTSNTHPVILSQRLLMLACLSQYSSRDSKDIQEQRKARTQSMATAAMDLVTTKDHLVRNAEGLECLMLAATYHYNSGNLRQAFTIVRRTMALAQLLGIHRLVHRGIQQIDNTSPKFDAAYMWYRILYIDRMLCLVLGLPQGSTDVNFASPATMRNLDVEQRAERELCILASRILDRNECDVEVWSVTESIDKSSQDLASSLPTEWWLTPTLLHNDSPRDKFLSTRRLIHQVFHFNVVNQTHLPFIFRSETSPTTPSVNTPTNFDYSKTLCWTSSREVLNRYLVLEESGFVAYAYTFVDFFTLIAAVTILLVHIDKHWQTHHVQAQALSVLSHTRSNDLAIVSKVLDQMSKKSTSSTMSTKGPHILRALLAVEEEAFKFQSVGAGVIVKDENADERPFFEMKIPFYGVLRLNSRRICFRRSGEYENVKTSVENLDMTAPEELEKMGERGDREVNDAMLSQWTLDGGGMGYEGAEFEGLEMAFFDSFQDMLDR
jgi:hypothetical protein